MTEQMIYAFTIQGHIIPHVRMTQRDKFVKDRAQEYLTCKDSIGWQLKKQMAENGWDMIPRGTPLAAAIDIQGDTAYFEVTTLDNSQADHRGDLDNVVKTIGDSAQKIVYPDDRWIDYVKASRGLSAKQLKDCEGRA